MSDHPFYDEAFFAEQERPSLRRQVNEAIDRLWGATGKPHSLLWRKAYLALEEATGFRVPDIKRRLDAVEQAGLMDQLLAAVRSLSGGCLDHVGEVKKAIPEYVPYESDRSRWERRGIPPCRHESGVFSTVLEDVALLVQCVECGAYGKVIDPTADEWQRAFHAPSNPYHWPDNERVELLPGKQHDELKRHIRRRGQMA
jgi:hypothetical protein